MNLSMDMAEALKGSLAGMDRDGDGQVDREEMDLGLIEMISKLGTQLDVLGQRMERIEAAVGSGKGRKVNLISG